MKPVGVFGKYFTLYHAGKLAVDPERPWQLISKIGAHCGRFRTREKGLIALDALVVDMDNGILPCNLSLWNKHHLLEDA